MHSAALILSIDTATTCGGVCLFRDGETLASTPTAAQMSHSNTLLRDINELLKTIGAAVGDIDLFAVARGPGSFTGLRIGIATVKGLAATLGRPCVGISTLHAIAAAAGPSSATVSLLPAGRGELFAQLLTVDSAGEVSEIDGPVHQPAQKIIEKYSDQDELVWAGPGAHAQEQLLREAAQRSAYSLSTFPTDEHGWRLAPLPANLSIEIAALAIRQSEGNAADLRALYVRPSDPELKNVSN
jgi:tRNA threonylcarbamoyladenosine biosynthesis protein TsaB